MGFNVLIADDKGEGMHLGGNMEKVERMLKKAKNLKK